MPNLLDLMSAEERARAIAKGAKRLAKKKGADVSPEMYVVAEFGYYFGFEGVLAIKRGYIESLDEEGNVIYEPFTLDEVLALLDAAKKVWYTKLIESSHGNMVSTNAAHSKSPSQRFNQGMKPFTDRAELT